MRKFICAQSDEQLIRIGWLSLQPDAARSISFGLNDRAYIAPKLQSRHNSPHARYRFQYAVSSEPEALESVRNPHLTYHPPMFFHFKSNSDRSSKDEDLFQGIARIPIVLDRDVEMPWIRATSARLSTLRPALQRNDSVPSENLILRVPSKDLSVRISVDFIRPAAVAAVRENPSTWAYEWGEVALRVSASFTYPSVPTFSWVHHG